MFEFGGLAPKVLPEISFRAWLAPNVNSNGGISRAGREKMEVVPTLLNAGIGTESLTLGNPKLNEGAATTGGKAGKVGLPLPADPKIFSSYSCSCR